jgi:hypothetical protein
MCSKTYGKDSILYEELVRVACRPDRVLQWTDDLEFYEDMTKVDDPSGPRFGYHVSFVV